MATSDSFSIVLMSQKDPRAKYLIKNVIQYIELNQDKNDAETRATSVGIFSQEHIGVSGKFIGTTGMEVQYYAFNLPMWFLQRNSVLGFQIHSTGLTSNSTELTSSIVSYK